MQFPFAAGSEGINRAEDVFHILEVGHLAAAVYLGKDGEGGLAGFAESLDESPPLQAKDLELKMLSDRGLALVASPSLIERFGMPHSPADLHDWPSISLSTSQAEHRWVLNGPENSKATINHQPKLVTDDMIALRRVAMAGVGAVQLPILTVLEQLESGELVRLLPEWQPHRDIIHVVYPCRRGLLPAIRTLIDELEKYYSSFSEA